MHTPSSPARPPLVPARIWRRLVAFLLDLVVLLPILGGLGWAWIALFDVKLPTDRLPLVDYLVQLHLQGDPLVLGGLLFLGLAAGVYFLLGHQLWGRTLGMWTLGLVVVDGSGQPPGPGTAATRVLGAALSASYFGLGFLWIAFDRERQGFHDKIANTWVIQRNAL